MLNRDGVSIYYEWHPSDAPDAQTVLLSHGYSASCAMWPGQIDVLGDRYNLITWDMRGHGRSDSPGDSAL